MDLLTGAHGGAARAEAEKIGGRVQPAGTAPTTVLLIITPIAILDIRQ